MRKALVVLFGVLAVALTFGLCTTMAQKAYATLDCYGCPGLGGILGWNPTPTSTNASSGAFGFTASIAWSLDPEPTSATVAQASTGSTNILDVEYNPSLFFPNSGYTDENGDECCSGTITILITGHLSDPDVDGALRSKVYVPYVSHFKTVTIYH